MSDEKPNTSKKNATRLPSLKEPRDLTLGGIVKRKFAPTIPAPKTKKGNNDVVDQEIKTEYEHKSTGREKSGKKDFKEKQKHDLIQLKSIFDEGPKEEFKIKNESSRRAYSDRDYTSTSIKIEENKSHHQNGDNKDVLDKLLNDDFVIEDEKSDDSDENFNEKGIKPTILPFKLEPPPKSEEKEFTFEEFFKDDLFLIELPDVLPGNPPTDPSILANKNAEVKDEKRHLGAFSEGIIGKLRYHKNGKMTLLINDIVFNVERGLTSTVLQEVVSFDINEVEETGQMNVLGAVTQKLNIVPDIDSMLDSIDEKK